MVAGTTTALDPKHSLLRSGEEIRDLDNEAAPTNDFFDFGELRASDDHRGFVRWRATSMDWEQHDSCGGPEGCIVRARGRKRHDTHVYRFQVEHVTKPLSCDTRTVQLAAYHWPDADNEAHSHVMADHLSRAAKKTVRRHLQLIALLALAPPPP